ncbi:MAG: glycosyltransferase [Psychrobacillus psychrodurans]
MNNPRISVIMGIYNCENTLTISLSSLMEQTFQDFEVIMCDDGSVDNSYNIAKTFVDKYPKKFFLLKNEKNMGLNYTLNVCLKNIKGEYVARMDGDDISLPTRFEKQINFLDTNPNIGIVSSAMIFFDETGDFGRSIPILYPKLKDLIRGTPFAHAPCMVRREAYFSVNGYTVDKRLLRVEDYHLWTKMYAKGYRGYNIQEPLYKMRDDKNAVNRRSFKNRINEAYVKFLVIKMLNLPVWNMIFILRPIIIGLLPKKIYLLFHKKRLSN